jgi:purine-binding chemotaxis protein CheW
MTRQFMTFYLDDHFLGIEVTEVKEVIRSRDVVRVPLARAEVAGLMNLRGQIVTAIDLRSRLRLPPREASIEPMNVIVEREGGAVSLLVDEVGGVREVGEDVFEEPTENLRSDMRGLIRGAFKLADELLLELDLEEALAIGKGTDHVLKGE